MRKHYGYSLIIIGSAIAFVIAMFVKFPILRDPEAFLGLLATIIFVLGLYYGIRRINRGG